MADIFSFQELIESAFGDPNANTVNFKVVQTILYILARQLGILERLIQVDLISDRPISSSVSTLSVTELKIKVNKGPDHSQKATTYTVLTSDKPKKTHDDIDYKKKKNKYSKKLRNIDELSDEFYDDDYNHRNKNKQDNPKNKDDGPDATKKMKVKPERDKVKEVAQYEDVVYSQGYKRTLKEQANNLKPEVRRKDKYDDNENIDIIASLKTKQGAEYRQGGLKTQDGDSYEDKTAVKSLGDESSYVPSGKMETQCPQKRLEFYDNAVTKSKKMQIMEDFQYAFIAEDDQALSGTDDNSSEESASDKTKQNLKYGSTQIVSSFYKDKTEIKTKLKQNVRAHSIIGERPMVTVKDYKGDITRLFEWNSAISEDNEKRKLGFSQKKPNDLGKNVDDKESDGAKYRDQKETSTINKEHGRNSKDFPKSIIKTIGSIVYLVRIKKKQKARRGILKKSAKKGKLNKNEPFRDVDASDIEFGFTRSGLLPDIRGFGRNRGESELRSRGASEETGKKKDTKHRKSESDYDFTGPYQKRAIKHQGSDRDRDFDRGSQFDESGRKIRDRYDDDKSDEQTRRRKSRGHDHGSDDDNVDYDTQVDKYGRSKKDRYDDTQVDKYGRSKKDRYDDTQVDKSGRSKKDRYDDEQGRDYKSGKSEKNRYDDSKTDEQSRRRNIRGRGSGYDDKDNDGNQVDSNAVQKTGRRKSRYGLDRSPSLNDDADGGKSRQLTKDGIGAESSNDYRLTFDNAISYDSDDENARSTKSKKDADKSVGRDAKKKAKQKSPSKGGSDNEPDISDAENTRQSTKGGKRNEDDDRSKKTAKQKSQTKGGRSESDDSGEHVAAKSSKGQKIPLEVFEETREQELRVISQRADSMEEPDADPIPIKSLSNSEAAIAEAHVEKRKGGKGKDKHEEIEEEKLLVVERIPLDKDKAREYRESNGLQVAIVTQPEFAALVDEVKKIEYKLKPKSDKLTLPGSAELLDNIRKGASLTDAMAALQLSARIEAAEGTLENIIEMVTKLARYNPELDKAFLKQKAAGEKREYDTLSGMQSMVSRPPTTTAAAKRASDKGEGYYDVSGAGYTQHVKCTEDCVSREEFNQAILKLNSELAKEITEGATKQIKKIEAVTRSLKSFENKVEETLTFSNRMDNLESAVANYSERITSMDTGISMQMTSYQDQLSQMQYELEEALETMAEGLANAQGDPAAVAELNRKFNIFQEDLTKVVDLQCDLNKKQQGTDIDLEAIRKVVEVLRESKADREEVADALHNKVGLGSLNGLVTLEHFGAIRGDLEKKIVKAYDKFNSQELVWQKLISDLVKELNVKTNMDVVQNLHDDIEDKINMLANRIQVLRDIVGDPRAFAITKRINQHAECLSCKTPAHMAVEDTSKIEPEPKTMEADDLCFPGFPIPASKLDPRSIICKRYCGGSHTVQKVGRTQSPLTVDVMALDLPTTEKGINGKEYRTDIKEESTAKVPCRPCKPVPPQEPLVPEHEHEDTKNNLSVIHDLTDDIINPTLDDEGSKNNSEDQKLIKVDFNDISNS